MRWMLRQRYVPVSPTKEGKMTAAFTVGLLAGTFFFNLWGKHCTEELLIYKGLLMGRYEAGGLAGIALCFYLLRKRGKRFLLLLGMELTEFCVAGRMLYAVYYGFCAGVCLSFFVFQYAFWGILYYLALLFPHYAGYGMMWYVLNQTLRFSCVSRRILLSGILFLLGIFLEGYVHAELIERFLHILIP